MGNINVTFNAEKNGIEIRFTERPDDTILAMMKMNGYRWSNRQKMWYAKQNEQTIGVANSLTNGECNSDTLKNKTENDSYDLWALTRVDAIENHVDKNRDPEPKEIAAEVRRHLKPRFPMCSVSITSDYNSIHACITSSPFKKDSDELKAICEYISAYIMSYKYCTCYDPYGDYGSSYNFYFGKCHTEYNYKQAEMTVAVGAICEDFQQHKEAFEAAEAERQEIELKERMERDRIEREEAAKRARIEEEKRDRIQACVSSKSVEYFVENLVDYGCRKQNSTDEYHEYGEEAENRPHTCKVTKEVYMNKEQYDFFKDHLMMDWSFVACTGGTVTDDLRIACMQDYQMMSKEERETVEWYDTDCVAIFCDGQAMCVVDAQGFDYCRYVYFYNNDTKVTDVHNSAQVITEEDRARDRVDAESLIDISTSVIEQNKLFGIWNTDGFDIYKEAMKDYIYSNKARFDIGVIRAIDPADEQFKTAMYKLLVDMRSIREQFKRADLQPGQKITIVKLGEFGGVNIIRATFDSFQETKYAQYDDAVKLIVTPERKRNKHYMYIYSDVMVFAGWQPDIPDHLLWDIEESNGGIITKRGRFSSFDEEQYNVVFEYYKNLGAPLVIDTRSNGVYK